MDTVWTTSIWRQFGAALDMLENALRACPEDLWAGRLWPEQELGPEFAEFWYVAYHTLFWVDLYLSGAVEGFTPPAPFTLAELDPAGLLPDRRYTPAELLAYLEHDRQKARGLLAALTPEQAQRICRFPWGTLPFAELLLDNMRHIQEHGAQLNLFLGQTKGAQARWVAQTKH